MLLSLNTHFSAAQHSLARVLYPHFVVYQFLSSSSLLSLFVLISFSLLHCIIMLSVSFFPLLCYLFSHVSVSMLLFSLFGSPLLCTSTIVRLSLSLRLSTFFPFSVDFQFSSCVTLFQIFTWLPFHCMPIAYATNTHNRLVSVHSTILEFI